MSKKKIKQDLLHRMKKIIAYYANRDRAVPLYGKSSSSDLLANLFSDQELEDFMGGKGSGGGGGGGGVGLRVEKPPKKNSMRSGV